MTPNLQNVELILTHISVAEIAACQICILSQYDPAAYQECSHDLIQWSPKIYPVCKHCFRNKATGVWLHFGKYVLPLQVRQFSTATTMFIYPKLCQPEHSGLSCQNPHTDCLLQSLVHKLLWIMFSNTMNPAAQLAWGQHCLPQISSSRDCGYELDCQKQLA